jgi:DNA-binding transcriptional ArsR family regulator
MDPLTDVLTALSHPLRRDIIRRLAAVPARFTDVARPLDVSLNAVSKHLKLLERAGLIERERQGREVLISLRPEPLRLVSGWVHEYEQFWNRRLDAFAGQFQARRGMDTRNKRKGRNKTTQKKEANP